jgi:hypothetical protein
MRRFLGYVGLAVLLAGCGEERPATESPQLQQEQEPAAATTSAAQWNAALQPTEDQAQLRGSAAAEGQQGRTEIRVELAGGAPGASHPWHIHLGPCGTHGDYFHEPEAYPPLQLDDQGRGTARAMVPEELQPNQSYHVNVHGADDHEATVACGELRQT